MASISKAFAAVTAVPLGSGGASVSSLTTPSFNSSGYTHLVVAVKHEGAVTNITISDNKGTSGWTAHTKKSVAATGDDLHGQFFSAALTSPGSGHTVTAQFASARPFATLAVWLVNADTGEIQLVDEASGEGSSGTSMNDGTLDNPEGKEVVSFMLTLEYSASTHTGGTGWNEDFDLNGSASGFDNYTAGYSRGPETSTSVSVSATQTVSAQWGLIAVMFAAGSASTGLEVEATTAELALTGQAATVSRGRGVNAGTESLALAAQKATVSRTRGVNATSESLAIAGQQATITRGRTVAAQSESLALAGQAATVGRGRAVNAKTASLALAAQTATVDRGAAISAQTELLALAGQPATVSRGRAVNCSTANVGLAGQPASIQFGVVRHVECTTASAVLTGQAASIIKGRTVNCSTANAVLRGQRCTVQRGVETTRPVGGDDAPRGARHPGFNKRRALLKLRKEREFERSILEAYRALTANPATRERAQEIVAPPVVKRNDETAEQFAEREAARRAALQDELAALRRLTVEAEIALRLLYQELREQQERDDEQAIQFLLSQVL